MKEKSSRVHRSNIKAQGSSFARILLSPWNFLIFQLSSQGKSKASVSGNQSQANPKPWNSRAQNRSRGFCFAPLIRAGNATQVQYPGTRGPNAGADPICRVGDTRRSQYPGIRGLILRAAKALSRWTPAPWCWRVQQLLSKFSRWTRYPMEALGKTWNPRALHVAPAAIALIRAGNTNENLNPGTRGPNAGADPICRVGDTRRSQYPGIRGLILRAAIILLMLPAANIPLHASKQDSIDITINVNFPMPINIGDLRVSSGTHVNEAILRWTEPGALGYSGTASSYTIKASTSANIANSTDFAAAQDLTAFSTITVPSPQIGLSAARLIIPGLQENTTYYFAIRATNTTGRVNDWVRGGSNNLNLNNFIYTQNLPPQTPGNVSGFSWSDGNHIAWSSNAETDFNHYNVYRSTANSAFSIYTATTSAAITDSTLASGTTYYYKVSAVDNSNQESALSSAISINAFTGLLGQAISTTSILWQWNSIASAESYRIYASTGGAMLAQLSPSTTMYLETNLTPNTQYNRVYRSVVSGNELSSSGASAIYTLANIPAALSVASVSASSAQLQWDSNSNPQGTIYKVQYSSNSVSFEELAANITAGSVTVNSLSDLTTYYFKVRAKNGDDIASGFSNTVSTRTLSRDSVAPKATEGLMIKISDDRNTAELTWLPVSYDILGNAEDSINYNVYKSTELLNSYSKIATLGRNTTDYSDTINGATYYYYIRVQDIAGNESAQSRTVDSANTTRSYAIADDSISRIIIPVEDLKAVKASVGADVEASAQTKTSEEVGRIIRAIDFSIINTQTRAKITNLLLPKASLEIVMHYSVVGGRIANGFIPEGVFKAIPLSAPDATQAATSLAIYWNDGVKWVKLGGDINTEKQTVTTKSSHGGHYQVRSVARAEAFSIDVSGQSHKIITPNGDGWNDSVVFRFENPERLDVKGKIYDLSGAFVADMKSGPEQNSLLWDGKDNDGRVVKSAVYIFQIQAGGNVFNGTIVVAR